MDATTIDLPLTVTAGRAWAFLMEHPQVWLGHSAPDPAPGVTFETRYPTGAAAVGTIDFLDPPRSVRLSWHGHEAPAPLPLEVRVEPAASASRLVVEGADEHTDHWRRAAETVAALLATEARAVPGQVQAVLFDADGVLQWPGQGWLADFERLGGDGFVREAFAAEVDALTGRADLRERLIAILEERGRSCTAEDVLEVWHRIEVDADLLAVVGRVRAAGLVCALATNQQSYRGSVMRERGLDEHFDVAFYSYELGSAKPEPAYFRRVVAELGMTPDQVLLVDDTAANVLGARQVGLWAEVNRWGTGVDGMERLLERQGVRL